MSVRVDVVNDEALAPVTLLPFICHWYCGDVPPLVGVALNTTLLPAQIDVDDVVMDTDGFTWLTVMVIVLLTTKGVVLQAWLETITTLIASPLARDNVVKEDDVAPGTFVPFTCHWYIGASPPLTGIALKVTGAPWQTDVAEAVMFTCGVTELVVTWMELLVTVKVVAQAAFDTSIATTTSPLARLAVVNEDDVSPATFDPFTCH